MPDSDQKQAKRNSLNVTHEAAATRTDPGPGRGHVTGREAGPGNHGRDSEARDQRTRRLRLAEKHHRDTPCVK